MRKLTLDLATLDVQSFHLAADANGGGTVRGEEDIVGWSDYESCIAIPGCNPSDQPSCAPSCGASCPATCRGEQTCITCNDPQCEEPY
jgi:hypothetical protein